jgi:hypothetical protein
MKQSVWKKLLPYSTQLIKEIAAIAKAVSECAKTGIYPLNPDMFNEEDLMSGEVPSTVTATMKVDRSSSIRGATDSGHGREDTGSIGDIESSAGGATIFVHFWLCRFRKYQDHTVQNLNIDSKGTWNIRGGSKKEECEENGKRRERKRERRETLMKGIFPGRPNSSNEEAVDESWLCYGKESSQDAGTLPHRTNTNDGGLLYGNLAKTGSCGIVALSALDGFTSNAVLQILQ